MIDDCRYVVYSFVVVAIIPSVVDLFDLILFHYEGGLFREGLTGCWLLAAG